LHGAAAGAGLGAAIALALLAVGASGLHQVDGEKAELAMLLAAALGAPASLPFMALGERLNLSHWVLFVVLVIPLNGALIGALGGALAHAFRWSQPYWVAAIPTIWVALSVVTAWYVRSH